MNKNMWCLVLSVVLFFISMYIFTCIDSIPASGISQPMPIRNMIIMILGVIWLCLSILFFTGFYFDYRYGKQKIIGVIPVRMASTRFPGKPLAPINNKPMLQHIYESCKKCKSLDEVYIATCDKEIMTFCDVIKAKGILTSNKHQRATDRVAEAITRIEGFNKKYDIIVMIQGDEPMVTSEMIDDAIEPLLNSDVQVTNLMGYIKTKREAKDKNTIKVVTDENNNALYFSRSQILHNIVGYKQVCIIAFTNSALKQFSSLKPTELEQVESIDMLRFLENNIPIKMVETNQQTHAVDVPSDIKIVERLMK